MKLNYLNYKEPLKKIEDGFGYWGTLAQTENGDEVQCHICGALVENLGNHVWTKHEMKARDYRIKYQLGLRTPLCSDSYSDKCRTEKLALWNSLSDEDKETRREAMIEAQSKTVRVGNPATLERSNKLGMCPDQLIEKINNLANKIGHSPTHAEFVTEYKGKYVGAIQRTFGSWNGAKKMANLPTCKSGTAQPHNRSKYSNEELLEFLKSSFKEKGSVPTFSDWRKGFMPSYYLYKHRFGGIQKARELAGLTVR